MLNFSKSSSTSDLQNRTTVQHKVVCDWLRQIQQQNIQLARKLTILQKSVDLLLRDEGRAEGMETLDGDNSESGSVS